MRFERHPAVPPNAERDRTDSANDQQDRAEQKPDRDRHVLGCFAVLRAVAKRTCQRLLRAAQDRYNQDRQTLFHVMIRSRFIFR